MMRSIASTMARKVPVHTAGDILPYTLKGRGRPTRSTPCRLKDHGEVEKTSRSPALKRLPQEGVCRSRQCESREEPRRREVRVLLIYQNVL